MPYWYYAGKTTACIDLPSEDDPKIMIPTVITPRQRFHAPRASVHHLLKTKPSQIKLLKDPPVPVPKPAPVATKPTPVPAPAPARDDEITTRFDLADVAKTMGGDTSANSTDGVLASPSSDVAGEVGEASPESEGASEPEKEPSTSSRKKRRRGRGSSSSD